MPMVGYFFGEKYLGLYGILVTITVIILVLEGGLCSSLISNLAKFSASNKKNAVDQTLKEFFIFFMLLSFFSFLLVNVFSEFSEVLVPSLEQFKGRNEIFKMYGALCASSIFMLYCQSACYGLGLFKSLNSVLILLSAAKILLPLFFMQILDDVSYIFFLEILLFSNFLAVSILSVIILKRLSGDFLFLSCLKFRIVRQGAKSSISVFLVSVSALFYTQFDKMILSNLYSLESLGIYSMAASIASIPLILSGVVYSTLLPKVNVAIQTNYSDFMSIYKTFSKKFCITLVFVFCVAITSVFLFVYCVKPVFIKFNGDFFYFKYVFSLLLCGSCIQAYSIVPYCCLVAVNKVKWNVYFNYGFMPIFALGVLVGVDYFNELALPFLWFTYNVVYLVFLNVFISKRILRNLST